MKASSLKLYPLKNVLLGLISFSREEQIGLHTRQTIPSILFITESNLQIFVCVCF